MGNDLNAGKYFFIIIIAKVHIGNYTERKFTIRFGCYVRLNIVYINIVRN